MQAAAITTTPRYGNRVWSGGFAAAGETVAWAMRSWTNDTTTIGMTLTLTYSGAQPNGNWVQTYSSDGSAWAIDDDIYEHGKPSLWLSSSGARGLGSNWYTFADAPGALIRGVPGYLINHGCVAPT